MTPSKGHFWVPSHLQSGVDRSELRFFECNYGTSGTPFDKMFGTFRDKMKESGTSYRGASEEKVDARTVAVHDSKSSLAGAPDLGFLLYLGLTCLTWALLWLRLTNSRLVAGLDWVSPACLAFSISAGPLLLAQVMANLTNTGSKRSVFYPFHPVRPPPGLRPPASVSSRSTASSTPSSHCRARGLTSLSGHYSEQSSPETLN